MISRSMTSNTISHIWLSYLTGMKLGSGHTLLQQLNDDLHETIEHMVALVSH